MGIVTIGIMKQASSYINCEDCHNYIGENSKKSVDAVDVGPIVDILDVEV